MTVDMNTDAVAACADLVGRAGAKAFEIGYVHEDVPSEQAGWWASAQFQGARILVEDHRSSDAAADALVVRMLTGADCRCGRTVTLTAAKGCCPWALVGRKWLPGCRAKPLHIKANRGDVTAMRLAMHEVKEAAKHENAPRRGRYRRRG